jgi:hypothetical protein
MRQIDFVSIARDEDLDIVLAPPTPEVGALAAEFTITTQEGDVALKRDLDELIHTPMYTRIYSPFRGHRFEELTQAPQGMNVIRDIKRKWRELVKNDPRVKNPTVDYDGTHYIFIVTSKLTGELVSVSL